VIGRNTMGVKLINLEKGDAVMDVARVVNEDEEPRAILAEGETGQELVDSAALEEMLDVDAGDDEDAPPPLDDLADELSGEDGSFEPHDVEDAYGGEPEDES
jgi:hypothetical protein